MSTDVAPKTEEITLTIDGVEVSVPKGSLIIRAAEKLGVNIPRFCDHPLLEPMGACRQCLVEIPDAGNGRPMPKPQAACTTEVAPGMQVATQVSSPVAEKAQRGVLELLLVNHPLDCPVCDKGGECPLQNQALSHGPGESRFRDLKRTFPKPIPLSAQILLDRERCVLCARCTRFSEQISGDPFIALVERGALQQVGEFAAEPYDSYFSGNVVQICPVGALTSADYRFQARPFDLVSTPSTCEHCAAGCSLRVDQRHFQVKRRLAGVDMAVNEEWNCDKGRFGFHYGRQADRLTTPLVRDGGVLRPASWAEAIDVAVRGLRAAGNRVGVLTGGRQTLESAYAYSKFARTVLGTNDIDFRVRPYGPEEAEFLAAKVAGTPMSVTYDDLEHASKVVLVGFEPEDESPIVFLRLRRAFRKNKTQVFAVAPFLSNGSRKLGATLVQTVPGTEASVLDSLQAELDGGSVVLVGERAGLAPGALDAAAQLADRSGAKLAWIPRRAGDRGALDAGCLPNVLPGGRLLADASARVDVAAAWGAASLPAGGGRDAEAILAGARDGSLQAILVAGVEARDFADPTTAREAFESAGFVVAIETRQSEITERADVVFPVALMEEQSGTFVNWEGRERGFGVAVKLNQTPVSDLRALVMLADAMGSDLGFRTAAGAKAEFDELGAWEGARATTTSPSHAAPEAPADGLVLATWRLALDDARGLDGSGALLETAPKACLRVSPATAQRLGLGERATIRTDAGMLTLPVVVTDPMADDVVWVPANSAGSCVAETLRVKPGSRVSVTNEGDVR